MVNALLKSRLEAMDKPDTFDSGFSDYILCLGCGRGGKKHE
jgi:hypothetical protein